MNKPYYITAYGLAVKRGFKGSMDEWLESLHGYVHIKYSEEMPAADSDMQDEPADWMGIYTGDKAEASTSYKDYKWHYVKGVANAAVIAPAYSRLKSYVRGEVISYGERIMACTAERTEGEFKLADWQETTLAEALEARGISTAVSYGPMQPPLLEGQKAQARANIGAMADGTIITRGMLDSGAVSEDKLAGGAVSEGKLAGGAVTAEKIAGGAVTEEKLAGFAVTTGKLAEGAVTAEKIAAAAINAGKLADGAVSGVKLNLANGDLGLVVLTKGVHYFDSIEQLPQPTLGRIAFVKADE